MDAKEKKQAKGQFAISAMFPAIDIWLHTSVLKLVLRNCYLVKVVTRNIQHKKNK